MKLSYTKVLERGNGTFWMLMFAEYAYKCFFFPMRGKERGKRFLQELIDKRRFDDKNKIETIIL